MHPLRPGKTGASPIPLGIDRSTSKEDGVSGVTFSLPALSVSPRQRIVPSPRSTSDHKSWRIALFLRRVSRSRSWQRDQNRSRIKVNTKDMEKIKTGLAELFEQVFAEKLSEAGYELTEERAEDVLVVRPAIINLDVYAPDVAKRIGMV